MIIYELIISSKASRAHIIGDRHCVDKIAIGRRSAIPTPAAARSPIAARPRRANRTVGFAAPIDRQRWPLHRERAPALRSGCGGNRRPQRLDLGWRQLVEPAFPIGCPPSAAPCRPFFRLQLCSSCGLALDDRVTFHHGCHVEMAHRNCLMDGHGRIRICDPQFAPRPVRLFGSDPRAPPGRARWDRRLRQPLQQWVDFLRDRIDAAVPDIDDELAVQLDPAAGEREIAGRQAARHDLARLRTHRHRRG